MALTTKEDVANAALIEIGEKKLVAFTDATDRAVAVNQLYDTVVDEVLADSFWGFAKKYLALAKSSPQPLSIPGDFTLAFDLPNDHIRPVRLKDGEKFDIFNHFAAIVLQGTTLSTSGATVTFSAAHGTAVGDYVVLDSDAQKGEIRRIKTNTDATHVDLDAPFTANQAVGTAWKKATGEKQYLITDASVPILEYVARVTTVTFWDPVFKQAVVMRLAAKLAMSIAHSRKLAESLLAEYSNIIVNAEAISGQSANRVKRIEARDILDARTSRSSSRADKVLN